MGTRTASLLQQRQDPLRDHYRKVPADARIRDGAQTLNACSGDPFHGTLQVKVAAECDVRGCLLVEHRFEHDSLLEAGGKCDA